MRATFVRALVRARFVVLAGWLALTLVAAAMLPRLTFDPSYRVWFRDDDPELAAYDAFLETFGNDDAVAIAFSDPEGVLRNRPLEVVDRVTRELEGLELVERVYSLTHFQHIHGEDDALVIEELVERLPLSDAELARVSAVALRDARSVGLLVSPDGKTTQILAVVDTSEDSTNRAFRITDEVEALAARIEAETGYDLQVAGNPVLESAYVAYALKDVKTILPVFGGFIVVLLVLAFRSPVGVVMPLCMTGTTTVITMGIAAALGVKINILTSTVPQVILAYGLCDAIHLWGAYVRLRRSGLDVLGGVTAALDENLLPCFLTSFTTAVGFLSLLVSDVGPIREVGLLSGVGVGLEYVAAIALYPGLVSLARAVPPEPWGGPAIWERVGAFAHRFRVANLAIAIVLVAASCLALPMLQVNSDIIGYFKDRTEIRKTLRYIDEHISGTADYEFVLDTGKPEGVYDPEFLRKVDAFQAYLRTHAEFTHTWSVVDLLKSSNRVMVGGGPEAEVVPPSELAVYQLMFLIDGTMGPEHRLEQLVDESRQRLRVSTHVKHLPSQVSIDLVEEIRGWTDQHLPGTTVALTGKNAMITYVQDRISKSFIQSLAMSVVLIVITFLVVYRSIRLAVVSLFPNVGPIVIVLAFMALTGIYLDFGTAMVGCIAFGMAVDNTIHLFSRFEEFRHVHPPDRVLRALVGQVGFAMTSSTVILVAGFSVFLLSDYNLNSNFGVLVAVVLSFGLLFDLFVTTALLQLTAPRNARSGR